MRLVWNLLGKGVFFKIDGRIIMIIGSYYAKAIDQNQGENAKFGQHDSNYHSRFLKKKMKIAM